MIKNLSKQELEDLLRTVFKPTLEDKSLAMLMDLPNSNVADTADWKDTRKLVCEWFDLLTGGKGPGFENVNFFAYENVGNANADLPEFLYLIEEPEEKLSVEDLKRVGTKTGLPQVLSSNRLVIAPTWFSCTAPLKILAKQYGFRGVTMPGFTRQMIPALSLDYENISRKVNAIKEKMDKAEGFSITLEAEGEIYTSYFDLRFRNGHASTGLLREPGTVGNLPSGEAYIVPYEGERDNEISKTKGLLPVQLEKEIVVYKIERNKAIEVIGEGREAQKEREFLAKEPAYGNIAEVGIGILGEFGVKACGSLLLDEKLGLHIAFGRSDHFGGIVGPSSFRESRNVVHMDRVYVRTIQPLISVKETRFIYGNGKEEIIKVGK